MNAYFLAPLLVLVALGFGGGSSRAQTAPRRKLTFNKDIAPIIFQNCSSCHRPGQSAPFNLLTYADAKKRAKQIAEVTGKGLMPPWLPEKGYGEFQGERRLTGGQIDAFRQWLDQGAEEGQPADLPPLPRFADGWQLGPPDLVVTMGEDYILPADGRDVYRNFVLPIPTQERRFVQAVEFQPGNRRIAHHAFMRIDRSRQSRLLDAQDPGPGFDGMDSPPSAQSPDGHVLSWQPGKRPARLPPGLAWTLEKGSDLVLQVHMHPSGKPERLRSSVAFYFTDIAPTNTPFKIELNSLAVDIPPGEANYLVKDSHKLPVDVTLLGILPHAHYLGKRLEGYAILPDGTKKWLLLIKDWDFNWQGDYRYSTPVFLPKGTTLFMQFQFDNSAENVRNPNSPPKRVRYGVQSTDEMAELWFQVLPRDKRDHALLAADLQARTLKDIVDYNLYRLGMNPRDAKALNNLGKALLSQGKTREAQEQIAKAIEAEPNYDEAHYNLGLILRMQKKLPEAARQFEQALRTNPEHAKAEGNLGLVLLNMGQTGTARVHLENAVRLNPEDAIAHDMLGVIDAGEGNLAGAEDHLRKAVAADPADRGIREHLDLVVKARGGGR